MCNLRDLELLAWSRQLEIRKATEKRVEKMGVQNPLRVRLGLVLSRVGGYLAA